MPTIISLFSQQKHVNVSYFNQLPFFVILGGSDVVQLGCQFLYVATKMLYCLQPVPKVTKKEKGFKKFLKRPAKS